jgi:ATP-dependent protease ClpP protease subunit
MAELNIFGQIGKTASDEDVVESFTAVDMAVFLSANNMDSSHTINIKSGGGYVEEGFEIYDMLRSSGKHITTVAQQADSIASVIFLAGDIRKMSKNAKPLIHFPFLENFFIDRATAQDFAEIHKGIKSLENKILSITLVPVGYPPPAAKPLVELDVPCEPQPPVTSAPKSIALPSDANVT